MHAVDEVYMFLDGETFYCDNCFTDRGRVGTPESGMPTYQEGFVCQVHNRVFMFEDMATVKQPGMVRGVTVEEYSKRVKASWEEYLQSKK